MNPVQSYFNPFTTSETSVEDKSKKRNLICQRVAISVCVALTAATIGVAAATFSIIATGATAIAALCAYKTFTLIRDIDKPILNSDFGYSFLHKAASKGHVLIVRLLIFLGSNVNKKSAYYNDTPLHIACYDPKKPNSQNHIKIMDLLVKAGADINIEGNWGRCPLHYALEARHVDRVKFLVEQGAFINLKLESCISPDWSPLEKAEAFNQPSRIFSKMVGDPRSDNELKEADRHIFEMLKTMGKVYTPN